MNESLLHVVWKFQLLKSKQLYNTKNELLEIIHCGVHNNDGGPDFLNARIRCNGTIWVGNVEIHTKSSEWFAHQHHIDAAYDNVILHVVYEHNKEVCNTSGLIIPTLELKSLLDTNLLQTYAQLIHSNAKLPCEYMMHNLDDIYWDSWMERMAFERLESKVRQFKSWLNDCNFDLEQVAYISIARAFGTPVNSFAFEWLARSLPLTIVKKCRNNAFQLEALFFGQAGMLLQDFGDEYYLNLRNEYLFLQKKYLLKPISPSVWKSLRLRPSSFPAIRISQFAHFCMTDVNLFDYLKETDSAERLINFFQVVSSSYWDKHYRFGKVSGMNQKKLGQSSAEKIIINAACPILYLYGMERSREKFKNQSLQLLRQLSPEKNRITAIFNRVGKENNSAMQSQAMLHLHKNYCSKRKCLNCNVGIKLLTKTNDANNRIYQDSS